MPDNPQFDAAERATILAALRFYKERGQGDPNNRPDAIHEIATASDAVISLDGEGIDDLYKRLSEGQAA